MIRFHFVPVVAYVYVSHRPLVLTCVLFDRWVDHLVLLEVITTESMTFESRTSLMRCRPRGYTRGIKIFITPTAQLSGWYRAYIEKEQRLLAASQWESTDVIFIVNMF